MVGLYGNRFSNVRGGRLQPCNVQEVSPAICALSGLIFAAPMSLHASTMLMRNSLRDIRCVTMLQVPRRAEPHPTARVAGRAETGLTDKFGADEPEELVLEYGATQREARLLHGQVANRLGPGWLENFFASVTAASRPKA